MLKDKYTFRFCFHTEFVFDYMQIISETDFEIWWIDIDLSSVVPSRRSAHVIHNGFVGRRALTRSRAASSKLRELMSITV